MFYDVYGKDGRKVAQVPGVTLAQVQRDLLRQVGLYVIPQVKLEEGLLEQPERFENAA